MDAACVRATEKDIWNKSKKKKKLFHCVRSMFGSVGLFGFPHISMWLVFGPWSTCWLPFVYLDLDWLERSGLHVCRTNGGLHWSVFLPHTRMKITSYLASITDTG